MVKNKINIIPLILYLIWIIYLCYYFYFKLDSFEKENPGSAGYLMLAIPVFSILFVFLTIIIISILNIIKKFSFYSDFQFLGILFFINIAVIIFH